MIANHPSWQSSSRFGSAHDPALGREPVESRLGAAAEHHSPSIAQAIATSMKRSPWTIVIASVSIGVLTGCLVKRR